MIRVTIELVPFGVGKPIKIGEARIANDGKGTPEVGNYNYTLKGKRGRKLATGKITGFKRQEKLAWDLLKLILEDAR